MTEFTKERAVEAIRAYAVSIDRPFLIEDAVSVAYNNGSLTPPPDGRIWGGVTKSAEKQGFIRKTGETAPATTSNSSIKPLWIRAEAA